MKCEIPAFASRSSREPAPIQKPSETERTCERRSEMTRSPESSSDMTYFWRTELIVTRVRSVAGGVRRRRRERLAAGAADLEAVVGLEAADAAVQAEDVGVQVHDLLPVDLLRGSGRVVELGGDLVEVVERVLPVVLDIGRRVQLLELLARRAEVVGQLLRGAAPTPSPARRSRSGRSGPSPARPCSAPGSSPVLRADRVPARDELRLGERRAAATPAAAGDRDGRRGAEQWKRTIHARKASAVSRPATQRPPMTPASTAASRG